MSELNVKSSWIADMQYIPKGREVTMPVTAEGRPTHGFLMVNTSSGHVYAYAVPSWVPGLVMAAKSHGAGFNRLVKGKWPSVKVA